MAVDKKDQSPAKPGVGGLSKLKIKYVKGGVDGAGDLRTRQGGSGDTSDKSKSGSGSDDKK
ncbi:MAG: hypothetical protein JKY92_08225 [Magnetovibrio sp.]|nr:hypothetical protein [Magnetovibrio sp.]